MSSKSFLFFFFPKGKVSFLSGLETIRYLHFKIVHLKERGAGWLLALQRLVCFQYSGFINDIFNCVFKS